MNTQIRLRQEKSEISQWLYKGLFSQKFLAYNEQQRTDIVRVRIQERIKPQRKIFCFKLPKKTADTSQWTSFESINSKTGIKKSPLKEKKVITSGHRSYRSFLNKTEKVDKKCELKSPNRVSAKDNYLEIKKIAESTYPNSRIEYGRNKNLSTAKNILAYREEDLGLISLKAFSRYGSNHLDVI